MSTSGVDGLALELIANTSAVSERTLNHLSGMPVLARHAEKRLSLGSLFELDVLKK
jgi:hypothetical protein